MKAIGTAIPDSARAAAEWFVTMHAEQVDPATEQAFLEWLRRSPGNESHYESLEALQVLTTHLRDDADVAWAFRESEVIAESASLAHASREGERLTRYLPGFGVAALAVLTLAVAVTQNRDAGTVAAPGSARTSMSDTPATAVPEPETESAVISVPARDSQVGTSTEDPALVEDESVAIESSIDVALEEARARLAELRETFTDAHPEVQATLRQIEQLEQQRPAQATSMAELIELILGGSAGNESGDTPAR
jgi:hypothetical protein